jgi:hypothetical protein
MNDKAGRSLGGIFPWACLVSGSLIAAVLLWLVNDVRVSVKENIRTLNDNLPEILSNTKRSTATLAVLSEDIKNVRDLAGVANGGRDRSLVSYADGLLDTVEQSGGKSA